MSYCINPHCPKPIDPVNANNCICRNCGSEILLQGRYRVLKQLGKGGFGETFEVDDCGTTKVLKVLTENNSKAIELFRQEAKVLSQLHSAGIPQVEKSGYFTVVPKNSPLPLHCLVMEKIEGVDLERWMESRDYQPISQVQALNWLRQLVEILALVHAHQYFHRDIKPQNIMVRPSGQLVLIDFGAVRQVTTTILAGDCHTRIFSGGYSPPEQQNGYSVQQSDFFALGRTFAFLLTGKEPQNSAMYDPLTNELHWHRHALHISPILADLINHLMAPTANQRPQNPQIILQRLKEIEKELNTPNTQRQKTKFKPANASQSSGCFTTVSVGGVKPLKASASQIQKPQNFWKVFIGLGVVCFAGGIAALNQLSTNNPVSPVETVPVAIPDSVPLPVTQVPETAKEAQPNPIKSPLTLPTEDTLKAETEALKEQRQAALKVEQDRQAALQKKLKQEATAKAEQKKVEQDRQAALQKKLKQEAAAKAEQEKQAAIREQEAARAEREKLEVARREKERQAALLAQQRKQAAIRAEQQRQALFKADQQRKIAIQAEKAKQTALRTKPSKITVKTQNKWQPPPRQQAPPKRQETPVSPKSDPVNSTLPWDSKAPIPKASDELEQVIREEKK
ncbi:MAG: protein kinase domain-containing protein [Hassallia sp.]